MAVNKRTGLATLLKLSVTICRVIESNVTLMRSRVPAENLVAFNGAISAILAACLVIEAINYIDV